MGSSLRRLGRQFYPTRVSLPLFSKGVLTKRQGREGVDLSYMKFIERNRRVGQRRQAPERAS